MNSCPTGTTGDADALDQTDDELGRGQSRSGGDAGRAARHTSRAVRAVGSGVHGCQTHPTSESSPSAPTIVAELGISDDVRLAEELVSEALGLITDQPDTLNLKIATAALAEMRDAFAMFEPYRDQRKVSIFGSARIQTDDPALRPGPTARRSARRTRLDDGDRSRSRNHAGRDGGSRQGEIDRRVDPAPVRERAPTRSSPATPST